MGKCFCIKHLIPSLSLFAYWLRIYRRYPSVLSWIYTWWCGTIPYSFTRMDVGMWLYSIKCVSSGYGIFTYTHMCVQYSIWSFLVVGKCTKMQTKICRKGKRSKKYWISNKTTQQRQHIKTVINCLKWWSIRFFFSSTHFYFLSYALHFLYLDVPKVLSFLFEKKLPMVAPICYASIQ